MHDRAVIKSAGADSQIQHQITTQEHKHCINSFQYFGLV